MGVNHELCDFSLISKELIICRKIRTGIAVMDSVSDTCWTGIFVLYWFLECYEEEFYPPLLLLLSFAAHMLWSFIGGCKFYFLKIILPFQVGLIPVLSNQTNFTGGSLGGQVSSQDRLWKTLRENTSMGTPKRQQFILYLNMEIPNHRSVNLDREI